jgi:hypothetical protein
MGGGKEARYIASTIYPIASPVRIEFRDDRELAGTHMTMRNTVQIWSGAGSALGMWPLRLKRRSAGRGHQIARRGLALTTLDGRGGEKTRLWRWQSGDCSGVGVGALSPWVNRGRPGRRTMQLWRP